MTGQIGAIAQSHVAMERNLVKGNVSVGNLVQLAVKAVILELLNVMKKIVLNGALGKIGVRAQFHVEMVEGLGREIV